MAISISQWLREANVSATYSYVLSLVNECEDELQPTPELIDGETYTLYGNLDLLYIKENMSCTLPGCEDDVMELGRLHYIYLMDVYKRKQPIGVVKIGVSTNPKKRVEQLNKAWAKYGLAFKLRKVDKGHWHRSKVYQAENALHIVLRRKGLQYQTGCKEDGFSELFKGTPWISDLI